MAKRKPIIILLILCFTLISQISNVHSVNLNDEYEVKLDMLINKFDYSYEVLLNLEKEGYIIDKYIDDLNFIIQQIENSKKLGREENLDQAIEVLDESIYNINIILDNMIKKENLLKNVFYYPYLIVTILIIIISYIFWIYNKRLYNKNMFKMKPEIFNGNKK